MKSRREFLQLSAVALTLPLSARADLSAEFPFSGKRVAAEPLYKIIFDERIPASAAFGREAQRLGAPVHAIRGDITDLWFNDLYARWKQGPVAIAGLTRHGAIFCLERLAWDQGMRVVFRADHKLQPDGRLEHALSGPETMLREAEVLRDGRSDWSGCMANVVTRCPSDRPQAASNGTIVSSSPIYAKQDPDHLISWVIALVKRA